MEVILAVTLTSAYWGVGVVLFLACWRHWGLAQPDWRDLFTLVLLWPAWLLMVGFLLFWRPWLEGDHEEGERPCG